MARRRSRKGARARSEDLYEIRPDFECDLHGHTVESALRKVRNDLATFRRRKAGAVVHVITGKGSGSTGPARIRPAVGKALSGELASLIDGFERDIEDGGFLVRLK